MANNYSDTRTVARSTKKEKNPFYSMTRQNY